MIKSEDKNLIVKGLFECSFCHADHCAPSDYAKDMRINVNQNLKQIVSEKFDHPLIYCNNHPDKLVKKYCTNDQSLQCNYCMVEQP